MSESPHDAYEERHREFLLKCRSEADIERARQLRACDCPRRYCWWWRWLSFQWDTPVSVGCGFERDRDNGSVGPNWPDRDKPCGRAHPECTTDHYEPREPHLLEDGFEPDRFDPTDPSAAFFMPDRMSSGDWSAPNVMKLDDPEPDTKMFDMTNDAAGVSRRIIERILGQEADDPAHLERALLSLRESPLAPRDWKHFRIAHWILKRTRESGGPAPPPPSPSGPRPGSRPA